MPYHTPNIANGLAFDTNFTNPIPPSLRNILHELDVSDEWLKIYKPDSKHYHDFKQDGSIPKRVYSNLAHLPEQGVLLLNTALTVEKGKPNSHKELWHDFTKELIAHISDTQPYTIFMLWGANALAYSAYIDQKKHDIIGSSHPSPLSNTKTCGKYPPFTGSKPFSKANKLLTKHKLEPIIW